MLGTVLVLAPPWGEDHRPSSASFISLHCLPNTGDTQHLLTHPGLPHDTSARPPVLTAVATAGPPSPLRIISPSHKIRWRDWEENRGQPPPRSSWLWDGTSARANSDTSRLWFGALKPAPPGNFPASSTSHEEVRFHFLELWLVQAQLRLLLAQSHLPGRRTEQPPLSSLSKGRVGGEALLHPLQTSIHPRMQGPRTPLPYHSQLKTNTVWRAIGDENS